MDKHQVDRRRVFTSEGFTGPDGVGGGELKGVCGFRAAGFSGEVLAGSGSRSCCGASPSCSVGDAAGLGVAAPSGQPRLNGGVRPREIEPLPELIGPFLVWAWPSFTECG